MRITLLGYKALGFYAMLTGAFFVSPYNNLFFLLLAFMTSLLVLNVFWVEQNIRGVHAEILDICPGPAGQAHSLHSSLQSGTRLHMLLAVEIHVPGYAADQPDRRGAYTVSLTKALTGDKRVLGKLPGARRGIYPIKAAYLRSGYPMNLLSRKVRIACPDAITVYPEPLETGLTHGGSIVDEIFGQGTTTHGDLAPSSLRDFRDGDSMRTVSWKASARRRKFVVKEFEGSGGNGVEVVFDRRTDSETLEHCLSVLAALAIHAIESKEPLAVHSQGLRGTFGENHEPIDSLLTWLAGTEVLPEDGPPPPPTSPTVLRLPQPALVAAGAAT